MPIRKQDYPSDWPAISEQVRYEAHWKCEWCGAPNGKWILRDKKPHKFITISVDGQALLRPIYGFSVLFSVMGVDPKQAKANGFIKVVLTVAHLNRDSTNNERGNLVALCQRCHLNHDHRCQHIPNRRYGRYHNRAHQLKLAL